ncbi:aminodeoxychorismate lyase [Pseudarthrobacter sp. J1738]|uniref:aminodeoxychorismate lyase n=1 Tax=Pseudarthrobacter sp. J1738 TaxID=3420446 RepID=UPI003D2BE50B
MTSVPAPAVLVFLDSQHPQGRIVDATAPQLMATDLGATRGDGVFESLLAVDGKPRKVPAHLKRLASSAAMLDLSIPAPQAWEAAISTAIDVFRDAKPDEDEIVVKLLVTRGVEGAAEPTAWVQASPSPALGRQQRKSGIDVVMLDRGYDSDLADRAPWLLLGAKTLSYAVNMAALRYAHTKGADDVIFTSTDGRVLEGPTSTVLLAHQETSDDGTVTKRLITPQLDAGILPGTSQGALFVAAKAAGWELGYGPLVPEDLLDADAVWLISSIRLIAPVNHIDGQRIGKDPAVAAALTAELNELFAGIS